jgi:hypothetical protein
LLDLPCQLLRLPSKLHAPQLGDQHLQMLDLAFAPQQLLMLRPDQHFQRFSREKVQIRKQPGRHAQSIA